ncbi:hypothetical protein PIROE2DRAFT_18728 [Piromyces sp. E2]|nr:hypothetical protein PIROE2DRAFT_18728 [Piromyces sp. E2]|eukprot:OUM56595.1 hypothetical protein PIROE2DRAFT_18728 [Piromyces sp. E2]
MIGEDIIKWCINDWNSLELPNKVFRSPNFKFMNSIWCMEIKKEIENEDENEIYKISILNFNCFGNIYANFNFTINNYETCIEKESLRIDTFNKDFKRRRTRNEILTM